MHYICCDEGLLKKRDIVQFRSKGFGGGKVNTKFSNNINNCHLIHQYKGPVETSILNISCKSMTRDTGHVSF